jgi:hypothetical protein
MVEVVYMTEDDLDNERDPSQEPAENTIQFNLLISPDRDGFLRRTCASCGRNFKTEIDPADFAWALSSQNSTS